MWVGVLVITGQPISLHIVILSLFLKKLVLNLALNNTFLKRLFYLI